jgi:hypothetical protein
MTRRYWLDDQKEETMKNKKLFSSVAVFALVAFEPGKAGWKMDAEGKIVVNNGNPVWVDANGGESMLDGGTISRLNGEAKALRERAEKAEAAAKAFEGLEAEAARKALETLGKIDQKKLIDAGEIDKVRDEISKGFTEQQTLLKTENETLKNTLDTTRRENLFATSKFATERLTPAGRDLIKTMYGTNIKFEDGKPVVYYPGGEKVYSKERMGELADVDEALSLLVDRYPHKDSILKPSNQSGTGNGGAGGGTGGQGATIKRSEFDGLEPSKISAVVARIQKGELSIVD